MHNQKNDQNKLSVGDIHQALGHIKRIILDEARVFDDTGHLQNILTQASITFDEANDQVVIEELRKELHHLRTMVYKDELTGALNRRGIHEEFSSFFNEALFHEKNPEMRQGVTISDFSVLFIDLDNFKKINDTFGHDAGDAVLQQISLVLQKDTRDIDAVGRFGGEEFVVAMLGATEDGAFTKAEEIRKHIEEMLCADQSRCVTTSIGVASLHVSEAKTLDELITFADMAMYEAKTNRGKNIVVRYSELKK